jgi:predicted O-methyltransferase YrrM
MAVASPSAWRRFLSYSWRRRLLAVRHRTERLSPGYDETVRDRFRSEVVSRGTFTGEWFLEHVRAWDRMLAEFDARRDLRFLEIGSYEGLSACFLLWRLLERTGGTLVCVDTFAGSVEHEGVTGLEERFDANIAEFGWSNLVRKEKGDSRRVLLDLLDEGASGSFDFVYVDGSHHSLDALVDAVLGWRLLARGGLLVFDDYLWDTDPDELGNPRRGIDAFARLVRDRSRVLARGSQLVLGKVRD